MTLQILSDFVFDPAFEHGQKKAKVSRDMYFTLAHGNAAVYARPLEVNPFFIPAVFNIEFGGEVAGKLVCSLLGIIVIHSMKCANVYCRHQAPCPRRGSGSLACPNRHGQSILVPPRGPTR